jgi:hypothetical protein
MYEDGRVSITLTGMNGRTLPGSERCTYANRTLVIQGFS